MENARAERRLLCPGNFRGRFPLPVGRANLRVSASGYILRGSAATESFRTPARQSRAMLWSRKDETIKQTTRLPASTWGSPVPPSMMSTLTKRTFRRSEPDTSRDRWCPLESIVGTHTVLTPIKPTHRQDGQKITLTLIIIKGTHIFKRRRGAVV